jgi:dTDP-glucose 4,6-dehydratase
MHILITGGLGFIGSALIRDLLTNTDHRVTNLDLMTYAASPAAVAEVEGSDRYRLIKGDISDGALVDEVFSDVSPDVVVHLAAETHVDRSIDDPLVFVRTNVLGTATLLRAADAHRRRLTSRRGQRFRFVHVSTDEVFGSLGFGDAPFDEGSTYRPNSPYSASKAGSDHLARAWAETYGLPVIVTNCSNNYGPFQFPDKLIPLMIIKAFRGEVLPVYGRGENVRDWLPVEDHARALRAVLESASAGGSYAIGGRAERNNAELVARICELVDEVVGPLPTGPRRDLIGFVADRPGHDLRYAIDPSRIETQLGWRADYSLEGGLRQTVRWYLENTDWWGPILDDDYRGQRIGLGAGAEGSP